MNRRQFLAGAVTGSVVSRSVLGGSPQRPAISFGFSLYGMRSLGLTAALETCAKIGYDAVELAVMPGWPADPRGLNKDERRRLRQRLRDLNLTLPALMENLPLDVDDKAHQAQLERLRLAAVLGQDLVPDAQPLIETILGGKVGQWDTLRKRFAERLADWARVAETARTVIAVKPHRGNAMNLPEHALWLIQQVNSPWVRLAYDYSHFHERELPMADTLKVLLPHTRFVHVKDVRLDNGRVQFLLPGETGRIDYAGLLRQLAAGGYRGSVCVEVSGMLSGQPGYDPNAAARRSYENLLPAWRKADLRR
jgi:sugar phosphate isomerase/epimerase